MLVADASSGAGLDLSVWTSASWFDQVHLGGCLDGVACAETADWLPMPGAVILSLPMKRSAKSVAGRPSRFVGELSNGLVLTPGGQLAG